jgi:transglutaminase-like putative cysteine protease
LRRFPTGRTEVTPQPGSFGRTGVVTTVALTVAHPAPFGLESPAWFAEARNPNPSRFRRAYRVLSQAQSGDYSALLGRGAGATEWSPEVRATYLETHPDPRFQAFADETIATLREPQRADPFARAIALKLRLDSMLTYSTAERHADAEDPAVDFFFGNRIGYCVHFAHTAVYLFRAAGIPSRIGVGYMSAESNRRGGSALVLQAGDAHAWPEVYVEGAGWIVLDIAAARNLDPPRPPQDEDAQQMLGEMAREEPPDPEDEETPPEDAPPRTPLARSLAVAFLLALLAALAGLYAIKAWRRLAPFVVGATARPRVSYRATLDRLAEVGMTRAFGETREQFAARAAALSPSFAVATERMLAVSLGPPGVRGDAHDAAAWAANTAAVRREVNAATPPLRRWLGRVHPLSFLDSR